jgi:hypothetical protein
MKKSLFSLIFISLIFITKAQDLKFDNSSPFIVKEEKQDKTLSIPFTIEKATKDCDVSFEVDDNKSPATKDKDYSISTTGPVKLTKENKYSSKIEIIIKADDFTENKEEIHIKFKYKDESGKDKEVEYLIFILDINDGSEDDPQYTEEEKKKLRGLSIDIYTGGNFDFFDGLKFQNVGGEFFVSANNIAGKNSRLGGFLGISNFQNFTFDSSNRNVRTQYIRIDTGAYINGVTKYIQRTFVDHRKLSTNQWSYYINPTCRLNNTKSDFFNIYLSLRLEALRVSTTTEFQTDTLNFSDTTNRPLGNSPVFQSGNGFLLQKVTDVQSNGFFSIAFPMFLNAKDKFKLYFDPNLGIATYSYSTYQPSVTRTSLEKLTYDITKVFYLFRLRVTEQFSGLNITIGGEIRGLLPNYNPTINAYLGVRANLVKWFSKDNTKTTNN